MKKIVVTEENFHGVLERLQKICNKYKMMEFYRVYSEDMKEDKSCRRNSIGIHTSYKRKNNKTFDVKKIHKFYKANRFIDVYKHRFRKDYEEGNKKSLNYDIYLKMKSLVYLDIGDGRALVISDGDKVEFLPFGGFTVWTDDSYIQREGQPLHLYKQTFIPDITSKIMDIDEERKDRAEEWEKLNDFYEDDFYDDDYDYED